MSPLVAKIGPSVLNARLSHLADECVALMAHGADYLHLDVMDGHFVPNLSFGAPVIASLRQAIGDKPFFDVHLMVECPEKWVTHYKEAGATQFTFHYEAVDSHDDRLALISAVRAAGMKVGISVKPGTPVELLLPYVPLVDNVLIMTVEPGFGGQSFMTDMMAKVRLVRSSSPSVDVQVDGGVGPSNILLCAEAGANSFVSGTAVVKSQDPAATIKMMRETAQKALDSL